MKSFLFALAQGWEWHSIIETPSSFVRLSAYLLANLPVSFHENVKNIIERPRLCWYPAESRVRI